MWRSSTFLSPRKGRARMAGLLLAALPAMVALPAGMMGLASSASAETPAVDQPSQTAQSLIGTWAVSGDTGGEKFAITFHDDNTLTVTTGHNKISGTGWRLSGVTLAFSGGVQFHDLNVAGKWKVTSSGQDEFKVTDDGGHHYTLTRVKA